MLCHCRIDRTKERWLTTSKFLTEQANDLYCMECVNILGKLGSAYLYNRNGVLVRPAKMGGVPMGVVPTSLRANILYMEHFPVVAGPLERVDFRVQLDASISGFILSAVRTAQLLTLSFV